MPYTIKYIKLFESSPFKKLNKSSIDANDDISTITQASAGVMKKYVAEKFREIFIENIKSQYNTGTETYYKKIGLPSNITNTIYTDILSFVDEHADLYTDLEVNISSNGVEVIMPCRLLTTTGYNSTLLIFENGNRYTPYNIYNGLLEDIFSDPKNGYVQILQDYKIPPVVTVKFKIMNEKVSFPDVLFFNYDDMSYADDFKAGFLDMFSNLTIDRISKRPVGGSYAFYMFLNCFRSSNDLKELSGVKSCALGGINVRTYLMYSDDIGEVYNALKRSFYDINQNHIDYLLQGRVDTGMKPNMTTLNKCVTDFNSIEFRVIVKYFATDKQQLYLRNFGFNKQFVESLNEIDPKVDFKLTSEKIDYTKIYSIFVDCQAPHVSFLHI